MTPNAREKREKQRDRLRLQTLRLASRSRSASLNNRRVHFCMAKSESDPYPRSGPIKLHYTHIYIDISVSILPRVVLTLKGEGLENVGQGSLQ